MSSSNFDGSRASSGRALKIAITVDPEIPVPPRLYGGIERIVAMLVDGLCARGHEISLFAHPESRVPCRLFAYPARRSRGRADVWRNTLFVSRHLARGGYDVIHSFARLAYLQPILPTRTPKLMSYQRAISARSVALGDKLSRGSLHFSACAAHMMQQFANRPNWHVIYNAAPLHAYTFRERVADDAPLVFLGRLESFKGPHLAIQVAQKTGLPLVLAGNVPDEARGFFQTEVEPHLSERIRYVGPVDDAQKNALLGSARAFLMPITWEEPFGIVMAEALACGTPVIGFKRGSVPEVVQDGVNGWACDTLDEMARRTLEVGELSRADSRRVMEEKFSDRAMVNAYEALYKQLVNAK